MFETHHAHQLVCLYHLLFVVASGPFKDVYQAEYQVQKDLVIVTSVVELEAAELIM